MKRLAALVVGTVLAAGCSGAKQAASETPADKPTPTTAYATGEDEVAAALARAARRHLREQARLDRQPRKVYLQIRGTATTATVTFTATGGGTSQRTVRVPSSWGYVGIAKLRRGDFAYISAQNEGGYGSVTCRIVENGPLGFKRIAPATTSSGAYAITDCNGTVR